MCSEGDPWHKFMTEPPIDWEIFIQPGGMEPDAENLEWLTQTPDTLKLAIDDPVRRNQGRTYYERFIRSNSPDWCTRYVHAMFGPDPSGTAVFRESFKNSFHVVDEVFPVATYPLIVGLDFGRDPCAVITQLDHRGRLLVLKEVIAEDMGLEIQIERNLRPALMDAKLLGHAVAIVGDPAGRAKSTLYEETSFDMLKRMGFMAFPAPTNDLDARLRAVEAFLLAQRDGGPAVLIDRHNCPTLVRALGGGYRYEKTKAGQRKPLPSKNEYSHVMDALQYACLAAHNGMAGMIAGRLKQTPRNRDRPRMTAAAWT
jgi:hypothetical protein